MIGVVADDTTGANDIGVMFAKHGYVAQIATWQNGEALVDPRAEIVVIDTDSRLDPRALAYEKVFAATRQLVALGCTTLHKKTCSVFRGNIGAEFDAMLDAARGQFCVVSLAFPKNGRQTLQGIHTLNGRRLEDSPFVHDPVHPTRESDLVQILRAQTQRRVGLVILEEVRAGTAALRATLTARSADCDYCIVDAIEQADLTALAAVVHDFPFLAGSSALAEELPKFWPRRAQRDLLSGRNFSDPHGVLIVSGSLTPQTKAQTSALIGSGMPAIVLDSRSVFDDAARRTEIERATQAALIPLRVGRDTLVMAGQEDDVVSATKAAGERHGLDPLAASKVVSAALAEVAQALVEATGLKRLVVAGGDTSGTVCRRLGIRGNLVLAEIAPGLPSGLALGRDLLIVLKSGSFGGPDFISSAVTHLKTLGSSSP